MTGTAAGLSIHTQHVIGLSEIGCGDLALVGGKGANLGELVRAGLPVPNAFCVSASAYAHFLEQGNIGSAIDAELAQLKSADAKNLETVASRIRELITSQPIPTKTVEAIVGAYGTLGGATMDTRVAVRSSATAEDLPGHSFAGQQDTYLGIVGTEPLLDAVRRCWASLWTARAIFYREAHGFRHRDVAIAVVVQEMFASEVSGVMFTVDPVRGDRRRVAISASWGLGEAIVAGLVSPDYWIAEKSNGAIRERQLGEKAQRIDQNPSSNGVNLLDVPAVDRARFCLDDKRIAELAAIGRDIESHYGFPQDIEWGYAKGRFAILQAREVTGVTIDFGEELDRWNRSEPSDDQVIWSRAWADAFQTSPTTPLMYSIQQSFIARSYDDMYRLYGLSAFLKKRMYTWYRTRPYYSASFEEARLRLMPKFSRTDAALAFFPPEDRERVRRLPFDWLHVAYAQVHALVIAPRYSFWRCADTFYREFPDQVRRYKEAMNIDFATASFDTIMNSFRISEDCFVDHARSTTPGIMDYCYMIILALSEVLRRWTGDTDQSKFSSLLSGLSTRTVQENIEIWHLARRINRDPELNEVFAMTDSSLVIDALSRSAAGRAYLSDIREFVRENGHRGGSERDLAYPRWRHRLELLINALRSVASGDESSNPEETEVRMKKRREQVTADVERQLRGQSYGMFKAALFRWLMKWSLKYVRMRDDQRYYADYYMTARHDFFNAIGSRLVARGLVGGPSDVFFLGLEEINELWLGQLSVKHAARRIDGRRAQHEKYRTTSPPFYMRDGLPFLAPVEEVHGSVIKGVPASAGRIEARARVCRTLEEAALIQKGDILVAAATDPGWTPIFSIISGVIVETGGPLAHATLVSREYGIPCVTNVSRATELIKDGQIIVLDGNAGLVMLDPHGQEKQA